MKKPWHDKDFFIHQKIDILLLITPYKDKLHICYKIIFMHSLASWMVPHPLDGYVVYKLKTYRFYSEAILVLVVTLWYVGSIVVQTIQVWIDNFVVVRTLFLS